MEHDLREGCGVVWRRFPWKKVLNKNNFKNEVTKSGRKLGIIIIAKVRQISINSFSTIGRHTNYLELSLRHN
jgi:hypothetical protein